ncbi:Protein of unknown function DUF1997 [Thalassoporum mexicanum PCC 7367]|uniref:DUF1997 domain-containing protein n=1 Tax=Thalassoporum mexicanum TaxID=3457544 RepID=UPI00029FFEE1|nr:DUF1997 domain-containing protein [Pseudanabaena sp. PCC 7367]AFY70419.1 Protein of unknown function DUF1997 [Pseudanabaena sp. PCC 7367]
MNITFSASETTVIPVPNQPVPIEHYLRQPQRLVNAVAEKSNIQLLSREITRDTGRDEHNCPNCPGRELFRLTMRPLKFIHLTLQPTVDIEVWSLPNGKVNLRSVQTEIKGIEYINKRFTLDLVGAIEPIVTNAAGAYTSQTQLEGRVDLKIRVDMPPIFGITPPQMLEMTGNGLLKSVLMAMKYRLVRRLIPDYVAWVNRHQSHGAIATNTNNCSGELPSTAKTA